MHTKKNGGRLVVTFELLKTKWDIERAHVCLRLTPFKSQMLIFCWSPNSHFGFQLRGSDPPFEDIALKFIQMEDSDALQEFLSAKLQALGTDDRAQRTMVAAWLTELHLDKINRALLEVFPDIALRECCVCCNQIVRLFFQMHT